MDNYSHIGRGRTLVLLFLLALSTARFSYAGTEDSMNIRFTPVIGELPLGMTLLIDFRLSENWVLSPYLKARPLGFDDDVTKTGVGAGVRTQWHSNGVFVDGFFAGGSLYYLSPILSSDKDPKPTIISTVDAVVISALGGYAWFWDSFNIHLALGTDRALQTGKLDYVDGDGLRSYSSFPGTGFNIECTIGWTF